MMASDICKDTIHFVGGMGTRAGSVKAGGGCAKSLFTGDLLDYMDVNGGPIITVADGSSLVVREGTTGKCALVNEGMNPAIIKVGTLVRVDFADIYSSGVYEVYAESDGDAIVINLDWTENTTCSFWLGGAFPTTLAAYSDNSTLREAVDGNAYNRLLLAYYGIARNPSIDPFTQVYEKLWDLLETNVALAALVKPGNRIKYGTDTPKSDKSAWVDKDFPELIIQPAGGTSDVQTTNDHVKVQQNFGVICTTTDLVATNSFFPVKWALLNALTDCKGNLGLDFVRRISLEDSKDNRNMEKFPGWNMVFTITVEMWFKILQGD